MCYFVTLESGWTKNEFGFQWLKDTFDKESRAQASQGWRLLILDGRGSHVNMRFINYYQKKTPILLYIVPSCNAYFAAFRVSLFSPFVRAYTMKLRKFMNVVS